MGSSRGDILPADETLSSSANAVDDGDYTLSFDGRGLDQEYVTRFMATNADQKESAILTISSIADGYGREFRLAPGQSIITEELTREMHLDGVKALRINVEGRKGAVYSLFKTMASGMPSAGPVMPIRRKNDLLGGDDLSSIDSWMGFASTAKTNGHPQLPDFNADLRTNIAAYGLSDAEIAKLSLNVGAGFSGIHVEDIYLSNNAKYRNDFARDDANGSFLGTPGARLNMPGVNLFGEASGGKTFVTTTLMLPGGDGVSDPGYSARKGPRMGVASAPASQRMSLDEMMRWMPVERITHNEADERRRIIAADTGGMTALSTHPTVQEPRFLIPGVCDKVNGIHGGFDTMIQWINPGDNGSAMGYITMRAYTRDGLHPVELWGVIPAGYSTGLANVFQKFGLPPNTYGLIEIMSTTGMHARAITYHENQAGVVMATNNPVWTNDNFTNGFQRLFAPGVANTDGAVTNFGLYAPPGFDGNVRVAVFDEQNNLVGSSVRTVYGGRYMQESIKNVIGNTDMYNGRIEVIPLTYGLVFAGFGVRVDNFSGKGTPMTMWQMD